MDPSGIFGAMFEPLTRTIGLFTKVLSGLIGGIFGVYLILLYLRFKEYKQLTQLLVEIKHELKQVNDKMQSPNHQIHSTHPAHQTHSAAHVPKHTKKKQ
ncbi:hypothetical protein HN587_04190 [Candidatus Woesearchaeota archaeon]|jgi:ABC-type nickel/cobalt efflux system permease component RcnA|nr:hypothetical protein [Candidatus Woesearchaeota archaeon]